MKNSNRETTPYIIGIDLGSNSVGFAAVQKMVGTLWKTPHTSAS